jgi:transcriptional regulator with XRE-family HTH domain
MSTGRHQPSGPIRMTFARACLTTRLDLDISRQELAGRVGVTACHIGQIERGMANPSVALIETIADALGLDLQLDVRTRSSRVDPMLATRSTRDAPPTSIGIFEGSVG